MKTNGVFLSRFRETVKITFQPRYDISTEHNASQNHMSITWENVCGQNKQKKPLKNDTSITETNIKVYQYLVWSKLDHVTSPWEKTWHLPLVFSRDTVSHRNNNDRSDRSRKCPPRLETTENHRTSTCPRIYVRKHTDNGVSERFFSR